MAETRVKKYVGVQSGRMLVVRAPRTLVIGWGPFKKKVRFTTTFRITFERSPEGHTALVHEPHTQVWVDGREREAEHE